MTFDVGQKIRIKVPIYNFSRVDGTYASASAKVRLRIEEEFTFFGYTRVATDHDLWSAEMEWKPRETKDVEFILTTRGSQVYPAGWPRAERPKDAIVEVYVDGTLVAKRAYDDLYRVWSW